MQRALHDRGHSRSTAAMTSTPNAVLIRPEQIHARSRAEAHAMAFLARYRVAQTRASYGLSLRQWLD